MLVWDILALMFDTPWSGDNTILIPAKVTTEHPWSTSPVVVIPSPEMYKATNGVLAMPIFGVAKGAESVDVGVGGIEVGGLWEIGNSLIMSPWHHLRIQTVCRLVSCSQTSPMRLE